MTVRKVLITGGTGLLGKALVETNPGWQIICTYMGNYDIPPTKLVSYIKLDILDLDGYSGLFNNFQPDVVIHAASIGSPDFAEKNKEITWAINVDGTKNICHCCETHNARLIHISSNGIYDGDHAPYSETAQAHPINYYGETKLASEQPVKELSLPHAVVRPILMYGWHHPFERGNILTLALSKLKRGEPLSLYDDVYSNPLYSGSCAEAIWKMIHEDIFEDFNLAGAERHSIFSFIKRAAEIFGLDAGLLRPVQQGFFNELVRRPRDTSYDTSKMSSRLDLMALLLADGLAKMRKEMGV